MSVEHVYQAAIVNVLDAETVVVLFHFKPFGIKLDVPMILDGYAAPETVGPNAVMGVASREKLREVVCKGPNVLHDVIVRRDARGLLRGSVIVIDEHPTIAEDYAHDLVDLLIAAGAGKRWDAGQPRPTFEPPAEEAVATTS